MSEKVLYWTCRDCKHKKRYLVQARKQVVDCGFYFRSTKLFRPALPGECPEWKEREGVTSNDLQSS